MKPGSRFPFAALACALFAAAPANAVPVVNTYQLVSRFGSGPVSTITQQFTLAFDPSVNNGPASVISYSASPSNPSFNPTGVQFKNGPGGIFMGIPLASTVLVGGAVNGVDLPTVGTFDFENIFFVTPTNGAVAGGVPLVPFSADTRYSTATGLFETFDVTATLVTSVPEPGNWALMILGLGAVGGAMRLRRRGAPPAPALLPS